MSESHDSPQGPTDPHGTGGPDAPPPPHRDEREQGDAERALQEENAGTSRDQPSDGSGGE